MARALTGIGHIAFRHSELVEAQALWEEALARAESAGDQRVTANVLRSLAIAAGALGRQDRAGELLDRAIGLAEISEDDQLLRLLLGSSAEMNLWLGRYQVAEAAYGDALELATKIGDISARPLLLAELGWVALLRGDPVTAQRLSIEAVELAEDLGTPRVLAHAIRLEGEALIHLGETSAAANSLDRALGIAQSLNADAEVAGVFCSQAYLALELQELAEARRHAGEAIELSALPHTMRRVTPQWVLGMVALMEGDTDNAREQFVVGLAQAEKIDIPRYQAACLMGLAGVDAAEGRTLEARAGYWQALELSRDMGDRLRLADCMIGLAASAAGGEPQTAAQLVGAAGSLRGLTGAKETPREAAQVAKAAAAISDAGDPGLLIEAMDQGSKMNETEAVATARLLISTDDVGVVEVEDSG
jgi:tetratricopeptide (TPR) repeat protein